MNTARNSRTEQATNVARSMWQALEPIHAVTYFAPDALERITASGTKGFWMGYFGSRSAPMGPVDASVVVSTFYNFAPRRPERAIPDVWTRVSPDELLESRCGGSATALRSIVDDIDESMRRALPLIEAAARAADCGGRPLARANQALDRRSDPAERLWQAATTLREHRGDGHVAALVCAGISGIEGLVMSAASKSIPPDLLRESRGWTEEEWGDAVTRLTQRGLITDGTALSEQGRAVVERIEADTDRAAEQPYREGLTDEGSNLALSSLSSIASRIVESGNFPIPNPIGLTAPPGP